MIKPRADIRAEESKNRRKYSQSFARQYLQDYGISVYRGEEQILKPLPYPLYNVKYLKTRYQVGKKLVEDDKQIKITSAKELRDRGLAITSLSVPDDQRWEKQQRIIYSLQKISDVPNYLNNIPKDHHVIYWVSSRQARLHGPRAGPLGFGPVIQAKIPRDLKKTSAIKKDASLEELKKRNPKLAINKLINNMKGLKEKAPYIDIPEAAFMISNENEIVCFPMDEVMPTVVVTGARGSGKSYTAHSIIDRLKWKKAYDYAMVAMNDSSGESHTWSFPNDDLEQERLLNRLGETPAPLPTVYFHPSDKYDYEKVYMEDVGFNITIPWKTIMSKYDEYLDLGDSGFYFEKVAEDLKDCKTVEEVKEILNTITKKPYNIPANTAKKAIGKVMHIIKTNMTDLTNNNQESWRLSTNPKKIVNPITACVEAGLIPVLRTNQVSNDKDKLSTYFTHFAGDLYKRQGSDPDFIRDQKEIFFIIEEAHNIAPNTSHSPATQLLSRLFKEGRPRRVGCLVINQSYKELHANIRRNISHFICLKNPEEAQELGKIVGLTKEQTETLRNLETFEVLAKATTHFIVYDMEGNRRKSEIGEIFIGKTLPTLSKHYNPKKTKVNN